MLRKLLIFFNSMTITNLPWLSCDLKFDSNTSCTCLVNGLPKSVCLPGGISEISVPLVWYCTTYLYKSYVWLTWVLNMPPHLLTKLHSSTSVLVATLCIVLAWKLQDIHLFLLVLLTWGTKPFLLFCGALLRPAHCLKHPHPKKIQFLISVRRNHNFQKKTKPEKD